MHRFSLNLKNLIFKPYIELKFPTTLSSKGGWQGNTIPLAWSTFWVHISEQILREPNRSV